MEASESPELTKSDKGRLKKLSKRASTVQLNSESGICNSSDWEELGDLLPQHRNGPAVHWRNGKAREKIMGSDLREILTKLLSSPPGPRMSGQKRDRNEQSGSTGKPKKLPSWVTIQNPIAVNHIGILELHVESESEMKELRDSLLTRMEAYEGLHSISSAVQWAESNQPKSISDILMYKASTKPEKAKQQKMSCLGELYDSLSKLILTESERDDEGYPAILGTTADGQQAMANTEDEIEGLPDFVATPVANKNVVHTSGRILGIDCEMVETTVGSELARVSLVEVVGLKEDGNIEFNLVWDELVKPSNRVTDYLTEFSGVTAAILEKVTLTSMDVQQYILENVKHLDIIVGHSAENDLRALRWIHPRVVDTASIFRPAHGRHKYSLKNLSAQLLHRRIQNGQSHCSSEDAVASVELACKRAMLGKAFGIPDRTPQSVLLQWSKIGTTVCLGPSNWLERHATRQPSSIHALSCENVSDSNSKAFSSWLTAAPARRAHLVYASLSTSASEPTEVLDMLDGVLAKWSSSSTMLLVCLQPALKAARKLDANRRARRNPKATLPWTECDEKQCQEAVNKSQMGSFIFIGSKNDRSPK